MIVFKTTFQIVKKYKFAILLYTIFLVLFTTINFQTSDTSSTFEASKPDIIIVNNDKKNEITDNLVAYLNKKCNVKDIENDPEKQDDALFYREVSYIIEIPEDYSKKFISGSNPLIEVKSLGDYEASLTEMILNKYLRVASAYKDKVSDNKELISLVNATLESSTTTEITSTLDTNSLAKSTFYFSFLNYSMLAGCVYALCLILSSYKEKNIKKRTTIASINYKTFNRKLLLSTGMVAIIMWAFYVLLSFILISNVMFTANGLLYIINSFVFTICALTVAFLIGNLITNKNAINGIINVVALGTSFICGCFVPMELLPDWLLDFAHILPSYWYIKSNDIIGTLEEFTFTSLKPIMTNMAIVLAFSIVFILITNYISKKKLKLSE